LSRTAQQPGKLKEMVEFWTRHEEESRRQAGLGEEPQKKKKAVKGAKPK
jgi:hypothetical protein